MIYVESNGNGYEVCVILVANSAKFFKISECNETALFFFEDRAADLEALTISVFQTK